ncbi:MAG: hypothetical protein CM1200mP2_03010 [Planctomycetaceae bacterium]|nr:MAG: hypothetical protein CM1200mP2_03010 [Planctomycetaceae bacterium]
MPVEPETVEATTQGTDAGRIRVDTDQPQVALPSESFDQ